ncbi:MAG: TolC family outer membrane protein [Formivibrio sp.]|nr:TolC family outer membrane protein [Formivibrio sp.]
MYRLLLTLLLASGSAWSGTDLLAAWQAARNHDPVYQGDMASAQAGSQKQRQAQALWLPYVGLQADAGYIDMKNEVEGAQFSAPAMGSMSDANFTTDVRNGHETRWGLMAVQPLYNAERKANAAQLTQQSNLAVLQLRENGQQLFLRVAQRQFDVLIAEEALSTLRAQKAAVQESLDIAKENFKIGKSASTDMHEAQASFDAVVAQEFALQSDLELKRALFTDLTGLPATNLARLGDQPKLESLRPNTMQTLIDQGLTQSPRVQMSDVGKEISSLEIDKYRAANATTVDLVAKYGQQHMEGSGNSSSTHNRTGWIGIQVNVPIFTGGMRSAKYDEAIALAEKARRDTEVSRQVVSQQIRAAYQGLTSGLEQSKALEQGLISAQSKLDATQTGREVGARTTSDVLNAQQAYFNVKNNLIRTRYQVLLSALALSAASGDMNEQRLDVINAFLVQ